MTALEVVRGHRKAENRDETVSGSGRDTARRRKRREGDRRGEDRAEKRCAEDEHDRDRVARLALFVDLSDPSREGEHSVPGHREDEPRSGYNGHARVLGIVSAGRTREPVRGRVHTSIRPMVAMDVMNAPPPFPSARAYSCTNGCGASSENRVSRSGVQNRKSMLVANPRTPVAMAL